MRRGAYHCQSEKFEVIAAGIIDYLRLHHPEGRDIIRKRLIERRTYLEIGERLGISEKKAKLKFRQAVKELVRLIEWKQPQLVKRRPSRPARRGELC